MGLFDLFSSANEEEAARMKIAGLEKGYGQASDLFGAGRTSAAGYYDQARGPLQMLLDQGQKGYGAYADATGVNGIGGLKAAGDLFRATPGITEGINMGVDQIDRRASARGMLGSGNTNMDTMRYAQDYANQKYRDYVSRLAPLAGQSLAPGMGLAGVSTGLGNLTNTSYQGQGGLAYKTQEGIGNANASAELSKDVTGQNILGGIFGLANLGTKAFGMFGQHKMADALDLRIANPPAFNFNSLPDPLAGYQQGRAQKTAWDIEKNRKLTLANLPKNPDGSLNYGAAAASLLSIGDMDGAKTLAGIASTDFDRLYKTRHLDIQERAANKDQPQITTIGAPDGRKQAVVVNPNKGTIIPMGAPMGEDNKLSSTDRKAIFTAEDENAQLGSTLDALKRAKELNSKTFTGYGAGVRATIGSKLPDWAVPDFVADKAGADATTEWQSIMSPEAIKNMSSTLKGATTNFELQKFEKVLADPSTPPEIRAATLTRMLQLAERQQQINTERMQQLRGGTYYKPGGGQSAAPGGPGAAAANPPPGAASPPAGPPRVAHPPKPQGMSDRQIADQARAAIQQATPEQRAVITDRMRAWGITVPGLPGL